MRLIATWTLCTAMLCGLLYVAGPGDVIGHLTGTGTADPSIPDDVGPPRGGVSHFSSPLSAAASNAPTRAPPPSSTSSRPGRGFFPLMRTGKTTWRHTWHTGEQWTQSQSP